jgi:hypothetical protein
MPSILEMIQAKQKQLSAKRGRERPEKLPMGQSRWRILPHWAGSETELPSQDFGQHYIKDFTGEVIAVYICTAKTFGKECPICESIAQALQSVEDPNARAVIEQAKSSQTYLLNAVQKTEAGYAKEPVLLQVPTTVFDQIMNVAASYASSDGVNIFDMNEGHDVVISKTGTGLSTRYQVLPGSKPSAVPAELLKKARNLREYVEQEHDEGKNRALTALRSVAGSKTPSLAGPSVATALPAAAGVATAAAIPAGRSDEDILADVDLSDINLDELDKIES